MSKPPSSTTSSSFLINGQQHTVNSSDVTGSTSLAWYLRNVAGLVGTKIHCGEGKCGTCMVTIRKADNKPRSVNSCLTPVLICDGWNITTVEGLGSAAKGYHPVQAALAAHDGSQCGFCSPGMVMSMNSYLEEHPHATAEELEDALDGNICRCTGYRPIMDTAKAFAAKTSEGIVADIEDLQLTGVCERTGKPCPGAGSCGDGGSCGGLKGENGTWHSPKSLEELLYVLKFLPEGSRYRLVAGNTGMGPYGYEFPFGEYIDTNQIPELKTITINPLVFGGGVSITDAIHVMEDAFPQEPQTSLAKHFRRIAATGLRNQATLGGNLMIKHDHHDFPSDIFICLETVGATLEIMDADGSAVDMSVGDFIFSDMDKKIITKIMIPELPVEKRQRELSRLWMNRSPLAPSEWKFRTFKVMGRGSLAYAEVHAGFLASVDSSNGFLINGTPRIVIGGIKPDFIHAMKTEEFLNGKRMSDNAMFKEALGILAEELDVAESRLAANALYRKQVALGLFYKFFLHVLGDTASAEVRSGATDIDRGLSSGQQTFDTDESQWPVSQPIEKLEGKRQASGEAEYVNDIPTKAGELHAAFVLSNRANCSIDSVDTSAALEIPGVVAYVDANDIPGDNDWRLSFMYPGGSKEEVFSSGKVAYAGQSIGLVVATTRELAQAGAGAVVVTYKEQGKVVVDLEEAMLDPVNVMAMGPPMEYGDVKGEMEASERRITGKFRVGAQYHYHMETHVCIVDPKEDGFDVTVATQFFSTTQVAISRVLNIPANSINGSVRRLGGAYGGKISLPNQLATAAAVAANKIRKPVRLWLTLAENMKMMGKRNPYCFDYEIGLSNEGKIHAVTSKFYSDGGYNFNEINSMFATFFGLNCYKIPALRYSPYGVKTHCPSHTSTRAPDTINGHAMMEAIMEHASVELNMDPLELKKMNMMEKGDPTLPPLTTLLVDNPIPDMLQTIEASGDLAARKEAVIAFNAANKWKKRGLSVVPMRYKHDIYNKLKYHCLISVYASDGTVSVAHGGIEMGQGINTKVAQTVARTLGIEVAMISIKPTDVLTNPNGFVTGGSMGSEMNCAAAMKAAEILAGRLAPIRTKLGKKATWVEIIQSADDQNVDLCARYMVNPENDDWKGYNIWGVSATEVEVDVLTGEMFTVRTDLLQDAGLATNPNVDVGQVEGAYVMGVGLWTTEKIQYDPETGELAEYWDYKTPMARDIPRDFRISLLKNAKNPLGVLGSKATGEPSMLMSVGILFAIRHALNSARMDQGLSGWWQFDGPATIESIHQNAEINPDNFIF